MPIERNRILEILNLYTHFLEDYGYVDSDVWSEEPTAIDRFIVESGIPELTQIDKDIIIIGRRGVGRRIGSKIALIESAAKEELKIVPIVHMSGQENRRSRRRRRRRRRRRERKQNNNS